MSRRALFAIALLAATAVLYYIGLDQAKKPNPPKSEPTSAAPARSETSESVPTPPTPTVAPAPSAPPPESAAPEPQVPPANPPSAVPPAATPAADPSVPPGTSQAPVSDRDIAEDLNDIQFALRDFRNALGENPVGTNAEITKSLMGDNLKQVKIAMPVGSQVNEGGELVDRWGTAYFFHQISGTEMEIRSAGPDRKMWTADDKQVK